MREKTEKVLSFLGVLFVACILSVLAGMLVAVTAHYRLGWEIERADNVGNTACTIVFALVWMIAFARK